MKFSARQLRFLLLGLLAASTVVFIAIAVLGLKALSQKSTRLVELKLESRTLDAQLTSLAAAKKQVENYSYFNDVAKTVIPLDKDQAKAIFVISKFAKQSGFKVGGITFPTSNLGRGSGGASTTNSSTEALSQAKPVEGIKGLYSLQVTVTPDISSQVPADQVSTYPKLIDFLERIERERRTAQIAEVSIQQRSEENLPAEAINFTLIINVFMRPEQ